MNDDDDDDSTKTKTKKKKKPDRNDPIGVFVRCSKEERDAWDAAADHDAKFLGIGRLRTSQWLRLLANRRVTAQAQPTAHDNAPATL